MQMPELDLPQQVRQTSAFLLRILSGANPRGYERQRGRTASMHDREEQLDATRPAVKSQLILDSQHSCFLSHGSGNCLITKFLNLLPRVLLNATPLCLSVPALPPAMTALHPHRSG